jgi:beta-lactamase regulating signal transducer with metallopeptidase domain
MTAQLPFTADLIQAFGWALLHSFWQAFLVFACLRLVLLIWPQAGASTKYNLSFISLSGIFTWFIITLWQQLQTVRTIHLAAQRMINTGIRQTSLELPAMYHSQRELTDIFPNFEIVFPLLTAIYVAGVAIMTIKLTMDLLQLRQIRRKQVLPIDPIWEKHLEKLMLQLQLSKKVKLLISEHVQVPVMIGFLKPLIILPVIMFNNLTAEQLEAILLHELAHIKRNDYLLNIFQSIVETILFFNPFVWLISKSIRIEREHCCDDLVITGQVQPLHYAKALVALEEYRLTANALAMAAANNKQHLFHRIKRIMEMKTKNINYTQKLLAVLIIAVGLVSIAWLNPGSVKAESTAPAAKKAPLPVSIAPAIAPNMVHFVNYISDTTSPKQQKQDAEKKAAEDIDINMDAAKAGMDAAQEAMKNIDWNQINADVTNAMKNVDWKEINKNVETAMKNIDWKEINKNVETAMKNIDWNQINADIKAGMKEGQNAVDPKVIQESIRIGMEAAKTAMNSVEVKDAMANAKVEMEKARVTMMNAQNQNQNQVVISNKNAVITKTASVQNNYKLLIEQMTADKLIDPEKGYTISKKDDKLVVNGETLSADVAKKYEKQLQGVKDLSITGKSDNVMINVNED